MFIRKLAFTICFFLLGCSSEILTGTVGLGSGTEITTSALSVVDGDGWVTSGKVLTVADLNISSNDPADTIVINILNLPARLLIYNHRTTAYIPNGESFPLSDISEGNIEIRTKPFLISNGASQAEAVDIELSYSLNGTTNSSFNFQVNVAPFCEGKQGATTATEYGAGTQEDPYQLCTAAQFNNIGTNSGIWSNHFVLRADIDLSAFTGTSYNIIGNSVTAFTGTLDGRNHTIDGFTYSDGASSEIGLFGYVRGKDSFIKNLNLTNANVVGDDALGILVSQAFHTSISGVSVEGDLVAQQTSGGLVSRCNFTIIDSSSFVGSLSSVSNSTEQSIAVGFSTGCIIRNSYFESSIEARADRTSLVFGGSYGGVFQNSYAKGEIQLQGNYAVSGFSNFTFGHFFLNSFTRASFSGTSTADIEYHDDWDYPTNSSISLMSNSYYDTGNTCLIVGGGNCVDNSIAGPTPIDSTVQTTLFSDTASAVFSDWDFENTWTPGAIGEEPKLQDPTYLTKDWGSCADHQDDSPFAGGNGTVHQPYIICTADQLNRIGTDTSYYDKVFELRDNIDLSSIGTFNIIGDLANPFRGMIHGRGYTISNLTINLPTTNRVGFIGFGDAAQVKNLRFENANIVGLDNVGIIMGGASNMTITLVSGCSTSGSVAGDDNVAGMIGQFGDVYYSFNSANVTGTGNFVGGIAGFGAVFNSYNTGNVEGVNNVGGASGSDNVHSSFSTGNVTVNGATGGPLVGWAGGSATNSFYDNTATCTGCDTVNGTGLDPSSSAPNYFSNVANEPLASWDFVRHWEIPGTDQFPALQDPETN